MDIGRGIGRGVPQAAQTAWSEPLGEDLRRDTKIHPQSDLIRKFLDF